MIGRDHQTSIRRPASLVEAQRAQLREQAHALAALLSANHFLQRRQRAAQPTVARLAALEPLA